MKEKFDRLGNAIFITNNARVVADLESKIHTLEQLSGKSIDELIEIFAAGWTLTPPDPPDYNAMTKLAMEMEETI